MNKLNQTLYNAIRNRLRNVADDIELERINYKQYHGDKRWQEKQKAAKRIQYKICKNMSLTDEEKEIIYSICLYEIKTKSKKKQLKKEE
jgi:hypothetical protein